MTHTEDITHPRSIRSFVKRSGRITTGQLKAREEMGENFLINYDPKELNFQEVFNFKTATTAPTHSTDAASELNKPVVLEIGFGMGEATAAIAQTVPY